MSAETPTVQTKWGPWNGYMLQILKDGYAVARRESLRTFTVQGQDVSTDFAKYLIEFLEGEGLKPLQIPDAPLG